MALPFLALVRTGRVARLCFNQRGSKRQSGHQCQLYIQSVAFFNTLPLILIIWKMQVFSIHTDQLFLMFLI